MILCARSTSRSREQIGARNTDEDKITRFSWLSNMADTSVWSVREVRKGFWDFIFLNVHFECWLAGRQTPMKWKGSSNWDSGKAQRAQRIVMTQYLFSYIFVTSLHGTVTYSTDIRYGYLQYIEFIIHYRPIRNMAAANYHKLIFVKQTNEPHREKKHVDISDTAKIQSSGPNAGEKADIWKTRK